MTQSSPAKINLTLRVGDARPDGFHEIESLITRVGLYDTITVSARDDARFTLACDDPSVPSDETNLALRAARRLTAAAGRRDCGVHITLQKCIPAGAGLGGGSSNAATVLRLLNHSWKLGLPLAELETIGAEIGSDVPLFFHTPLCVVRGRGERVEDLPGSLGGWAVLILPEIHSPTPDVYAAWDRTPAHPARPSIDEILQHADQPETLMPHLFNDLEAPALAVSPALARVAAPLARLSGGNVRMTGSGSTFFRLFDERRHADTLSQRVRAELKLRTEVVSLQT